MRHKDPELMNRIKQYISEYYLENAGAMPTITQIASAMKIVRSTAYTYLVAMDRLIIPGLFEPPVRTLRATIPENESHIFR